MGSGASKSAPKEQSKKTLDLVVEPEQSKKALDNGAQPGEVPNAPRPLTNPEEKQLETAASEPGSASKKQASKSVKFEVTKSSGDEETAAAASKTGQQKDQDEEQSLARKRSKSKQTADEPESKEPAPASKTTKKEDTKDSENAMQKEASDILKTELKLYEKTKSIWASSDLTSKELQDHIQAVKESYSAFKKFPYRIKFENRGKLFSPVISTGTVDIVYDLAVKMLKENTYVTQDEQGKRQVKTDLANMLLNCLQIICSFTDTSPKIRQHVVDRKDLLPLLVQKLDEWFQPHMDDTFQGVENKLVNRSLTALFMVAAQEDRKHMDVLREIEGFFPVVRKYLSSKNTDNRLHAIASLAYVATEAEAEDIATDKDIIRFVLNQLQQAYKSKTLDSPSGWTITGLAKAVKNLARNDANKRLLVQEGALPALFNGLKDKNQKSHNFAERKCCMESLWWLSFDPQNREEILKNEELLDMVVKIYEESSGKDTYKYFDAAEGFLFQLRDRLKEMSKYATIANKLLGDTSGASPSTDAAGTGHVMMSYQTQHRAIVKSICDFLGKQGFTMWMDIYNMADGEESTLQTMAEAVEGSAVVLMCVSENYKNSPYCRAEAEYAFMKSKHIIPLRLQMGYTPDGWLGIIQGSKYFYDFTKESAVESKRQQLLDAVRKATLAQTGPSPDGQQNTAPPQTTVSPPTPRVTSSMEDKVKTWTRKEIKEWLGSCQLTGEKLEALTPDEILYLYRLKSEAPEQFHSVVRDELGLTGLSRPASFHKALTELPNAAGESS